MIGKSFIATSLIIASLLLSIPTINAQDTTIEQSYSSLAGTWRASIDNGNCTSVVQLLYKNFMSHNIGEACSARGVYLGTYSLSAKSLHVVYAMVPDNSTDTFPRFVDMNYWIVDANTFIANLLAFGGDVNITYSRLAASPVDGVWNGRVESNGTTLAYSRAELNSGLFLSYALSSPNDFSQMTSTYGVLEVTPNSSRTTPQGVVTNATITYSMWRNILGNVSGGPPPGHLSFNASVLIPSNPAGYSAILSVQNILNYFEAAVGSDAIEGSYVGYNGNCSNVVNFRKGVYRSYVIGLNCNYAFLGAYNGISDNVLNATHVRVGYGFTNLNDYEGIVLDLSFSLNTTGPDTLLSLDIPGTNGSQGVTQTFRKVLLPPKLRRARVVLQSAVPNKREVIQSLDTLALTMSTGLTTGLGSSQVTVTNTRTGLVNSTSELHLALTDDQAVNGLSSDAAFTTLLGLRQLDRYQVVCVEDLEDFSVNNCNSASPAVLAPTPASLPVAVSPSSSSIPTSANIQPLPMEGSSSSFVLNSVLFSMLLLLKIVF